MTDRRLSPRYFDNSRELVSTKFQTVNGIEVAPGGVIPQDLTHGMRMRLWMSRRAVYQDLYSPTPVEQEPEPVHDWALPADGWAAVNVEPDRWALVPVSALDENGAAPVAVLADAETVGGDDAALERLTALRAEVIRMAVQIEAQPGGWYLVTGAWLPEPDRIKGKAPAEARRAEIEREGPPEGWVHPEVLVKPEQEITEGSIVTQTAEGAALAGVRATVRAVEDGQATVVWFDGPDESATLHELSIAVADLLLAPEPDAPADPAV